MFGTDSAPDYALRIKKEYLGDWPERLRPCVFLHETKKKDTEATRAQLAIACTPTLFLFTRMFADRYDADKKMPSWMVVYGLIHTGTGFLIIAHYPRVKFQKHEGAGQFSWKWEWDSHLVTSAFASTFLVETTTRQRLLAYNALLLLRAHIRYLITQFKRWATTFAAYGKGVIDDIIATIYDEEGTLKHNDVAIVFD